MRNLSSDYSHLENQVSELELLTVKFQRALQKAIGMIELYIGAGIPRDKENLRVAFEDLLKLDLPNETWIWVGKMYSQSPIVQELIRERVENLPLGSGTF